MGEQLELHHRRGDEMPRSHSTAFQSERSRLRSPRAFFARQSECAAKQQQLLGEPALLASLVGTLIKNQSGGREMFLAR